MENTLENNNNIVVNSDIVEQSLLFYHDYLKDHLDMASISESDKKLIASTLPEIYDTHQEYTNPNSPYLREKLESLQGKENFFIKNTSHISFEILDEIILENKIHSISNSINRDIDGLNELIYQDTDFPFDKDIYLKEKQMLIDLNNGLLNRTSEAIEFLYKNYGVSEHQTIANHLQELRQPEFDKLENRRSPDPRTLIQVERDNIVINQFTNAKETALNVSDHLKTNTMENQNNSTKEQLEGYVAKISDLKGTEKKYYDISIGVSKEGEEKKYETVRHWQDSKVSLKLNVGDQVKLEGNFKELTNNEKKTYRVFNPSALLEHKPVIPKESVSLTGYLAQDPEIKNLDGGKRVATLVIPKVNFGETEWKRVQVWDDKIPSVESLKKGDLVTIEGKEGKEYSFKKKDANGNEIGTETAKDIIAKSVTKVEKNQQEHLTLSATNKQLLDTVASGDYKAVAAALKKGADHKLVTPEILSKLPEAQRAAVENVINKHETALEKKNNKGVKI